MYSSLASRILAVLISASLFNPAWSLGKASTLAPGTFLQPLNADVFERGAGLIVRSLTDLSRLSLEDRAHLVYGANGEDGQFLLANMTLHAPNGLKLIMMERFEGLTSKVDCEGDDGKMSLTFQSKEAFDFALKEWAWINADKEKSFVLVANHDGCGPDSERQAYRINQVNHDEASLTTALDAMPAPWDDVAGTYDLDFGKVADPSVARRLRARNLLDDALETVKDAADAVGDAVGDVGDANLAKSVTFGIGVGTAGQRSTIFKEPSGKLQLDCVNCFLKGSFQVNGRLTTDNFQLKSFTLDAAPVDVSASLELEATLKGSVKGPGSKLFNASKELFAQAIPGAGISVPKIFTLGAVIEFAVAAESSISGEGNFTFGLSAAIPNGAKVITDLTQPELSSQTGFGDVNVVPKFDINKLEGGVSVGASAQPKLTFGVDVLKIGRLETSLVLKLPKVTSDLKGVFDDTGACSKTSGSSKEAVKLGSEIAVELGVSVDASVGERKGLPLFQKTLLSFKKPLLSKCFPVNLGRNSTVPRRRRSMRTHRGRTIAA